MRLIKIIITVLALFLTACVTPKPEVPVAERITVREYVLETPGHNKDEIFTSTKSWVAQTFVSGKAVTEDADKEAGRIIGNGSIPYPCGKNSYEGCSAWYLKFNMRIDMKDGKFKVTYSNIKTSAYGGEWDNQIKEDQQDIQASFAGLSKSLQDYVMKEKQQANW